MNYWLLKSEPAKFSLMDLQHRPAQTEPWDGVRNYQARNFLRAMTVGDLAFFYHSRSNPPAVVGVVKIVTNPYPDPSQFNPVSPYFDARATRENPRWVAVDVQFVRAFDHPVALSTLKKCPTMADMRLTQRGNRLSVMPIDPAHWTAICDLATGQNHA